MFIKRNFKSTIIWALIVFIFVAFLGPRIYGTVKNNVELGKRINDLKKNIKDLENQNVTLQDFIANFKKEAYIEKEAKTRLNLKKPGEKVVIIVKEEIKKSEEETKGKIFNFKEFWQKIKGGWNLRD